jgi:hypothetical protein
MEGKRMVSGHTGNVVPRKGLRVRAPCPPLSAHAVFASNESTSTCGGGFH